MKIGTDFSGIGAPEMALKYLGIDFDSIFACEIDKYARQSFKQLHNPQTFYNDITTRNHKEVEKLDLYVAGFPCQSFSMAGKRKGFEETRGTLFFNVAEFIKENQPKTFILENVKGLLSHDKGRTFQTIVDILSNGGGTQNGQISLDMFEDGLGYHIYWKVLNTKNYGIPQNRERIFIVGFKDFRDFNFPKEMPLELKLGDMLQDNPNGKYFLSDKMIKGIFKSNFRERKPIDINNVSKCLKVGGDIPCFEVVTHSLHPRTGNPKKGGTGHLSKTDGTSYCLDTANSQAIEIKRLPDLKLKVSKRVNDTPKEINKYLKDNKKGTIKEIALYLDLPKTQVEHYFRTDNSRAIPSPKIWLKLKELLNLDNKYDKQVTEINESIGTYETANRLYDTNGISPTLQTQEQGYYKTQNKIRRLTPLECWRLQGFKDEDFFSVKDVSDSQLYKQAGNSITVNVLMELFKKIYVNNK
jgi:DNA (cytosine-5)-methyltransferase 1